MKIILPLFIIMLCLDAYSGGKRSKSKSKPKPSTFVRNNSCAYLFEHAHFKGKRWEFCPGKKSPTHKGWNDKASSIWVPKNGKVHVCTHNHGGPCRSYFRDVSWVGHHMNDKISWIKYSSFEQNDFTMVLMSDPQLYWACHTKECKDRKSGEQPQGILTNDWHVKSINTLVNQIPFSQFGGVIINGDLTAFGHEHEYKKYISYYESHSFKHNLYPGLGNHDYGKNNVDDCWTNNCARRMVKYMVDRIPSFNPIATDYNTKSFYKFPSRRFQYNGSFGYAFDIGPYRFVQLHNYPTWKKSFNGWNFAKARRDHVNVSSSMGWIEKLLKTNPNKIYIFNWHDPKEYFKKEDQKKLVDMCTNSGAKCPVVFTGHYHAVNGFLRNYQGSGRKKIPVYLSGSPSYSNYLKVRFENDKITITKINAVLGKAEEYGTPTVINVK